MLAQNSTPSNLCDPSCNFENEILRDKRIGRIRHKFVRLEDRAQDFTLVNQHGHFINLHDSLEQKPVVINFYSCTDDTENYMQNIINLNLLLSNLDIEHYLISQDQHYLNQYLTQAYQINIQLLHDQNLNAFHKYGLVNSEINAPFEPFENINFIHSAYIHHINAMYLIDMDQKIQFSQVNFSDKSIQANAIIDEIIQLKHFNHTETYHESY